ncbi:helix-turn-helix domain-containing protein [Pseudomonas sp. GV071]|uniref:helix-turn-helix domain-containing protein n=1 Tax=Pseudomonas sp. GV071 TaxID=2135754 RepID=UPI000D3DC0FE|nr:helix-turn-helix transcriptional regulator [Pseudomonas sp. GV071]PTQ74307.1 transcriptional regulator with XRE-family HTH domain [Pseudomonas sp. GV071]
MELKKAVGATLKQFRLSKDLSQEDFADVSSRTYMSTLERGVKCPTLEKLEQLASVLDVHPLSLLTAIYLRRGNSCDVDHLFKVVRQDLSEL